MSAPQTNIEKQKRRHRGPLIGMIVVVVFALSYLVWWIGYEAAESDPPQGSETQIDSRTGETVGGDPAATSAEPSLVPRTEQAEPGVPSQRVDPQTPADVPAVDAPPAD